MPMRQKYQAPLAEVVSLENKEAVLQSGSPVDWYLMGGLGDFTYEIEEDFLFE